MICPVWDSTKTTAPAPPPPARLPREVGGDSTSQGGDAQCGEINLAAAALWKRESAAPPSLGIGPTRLCTNRQSVPRTRRLAFTGGTLLKAFEELLGPFVPPWRRLPTWMYAPLHQRDLSTVMAMDSNSKQICSEQCLLHNSSGTQTAVLAIAVMGLSRESMNGL